MNYQTCRSFWLWLIIPMASFASYHAVPSAPTLSAITASGNSYTVSWTAAACAAVYRLEQDIAQNFPNPVIVYQGQSLQKSFANVANGTYYYRVFASDVYGDSAASTVQSVTIGNPVITLAAPVINAITQSSNGNYTVQWNAVTNATSYILQQATTSNFSNAQVVQNSAQTSMTFTNQPAGTYYYQVQAVNATMSSSFSAAQSVTVTQPQPPPPPGTYKVIGYYPEWGIYGTPAFYPKNINGNLVTHVIYAFVNYDTSGNLILYDSWADTGYSNPNATTSYGGNFSELQNLKKQYPNLKVMFSVGGWTLSTNFSPMASSATARANFAKNCVAFCDQYGFDGIDIDWEYPNYAPNNGHPQDTQNFTLLMQALYTAAKAHNPPLLVTIAGAAGISNLQNIQLTQVMNYVDWINVMGYDFNGPGWSTITDHNSPIYAQSPSDPSNCIDAAIKYYLNAGVPASKLVLGMPLYGHTFANANSTTTGLFSTFSGAGSGTQGTREYWDIEANAAPTDNQFWDNFSQVPYLHNPTTLEFISWDNPQSFAAKCAYLKAKGMIGAMVWDLSGDDSKNTGMTAINNALNN